MSDPNYAAPKHFYPLFMTEEQEIENEKILQYQRELDAARKAQRDKIAQINCDGCGHSVLYEISVMSVNAKVKLCHHCIVNMANLFNDTVAAELPSKKTPIQ